MHWMSLLVLIGCAVGDPPVSPDAPAVLDDPRFFGEPCVQVKPAIRPPEDGWNYCRGGAGICVGEEPGGGICRPVCPEPKSCTSFGMAKTVWTERRACVCVPSSV
jgi:hypothetical protein